MPKPTIEDLRAELFATMRALKDPDPAKRMDIATARTIADLSRVIVESAKVEVEFLKASGEVASTNFLPTAPPAKALPEPSSRAREEAARLDRINGSTPPRETVRVNGEEFETVWDGAKGKQGASLSSW